MNLWNCAKRNMKIMENEFYCVNAFHNLSVNSTGTIKHCCMINGSTKGRVLDNSLEELWVEP